MRKFFFFRSSADKTVSVENSPDSEGHDQLKNSFDDTPRSFRSSRFEDKKPSLENLDVDGFGLRRSRSFSSAAFLGGTKEKNLSYLSDRSSSPSSSSDSVKAQQCNKSSRFRMPTPERHAKKKQHSAQSFQAFHDRSQNASHSSSDTSNEVLDLYIDGEQHNQKSSLRSEAYFKNHTRNCGGRRPPRVPCSVPGSPTGSLKEKFSIHSYRGSKGAEHYCSSRDWVEKEIGYNSPREFAKHSSRLNSNDHDPDVPITIEDVYGGSFNGDAALKLNKCLCVEHNSYGDYDAGDEDDFDVQSTLVKELDRRSNDWSLMVEKYRAEEQRLRERVRELAEQNVALQREVLSFSEMKTERDNSIASFEKQINDLNSMLETVKEENQVLQQRNYELQNKCELIEEDRSRIQRSYVEQEEECKELRTSVARFHITHSDQEKTIGGLRGELLELVHKNHPIQSSEKHVQKLQLELERLTGVEQVLRREIESHTQEVESLRHENVKLLERLKASGKGGSYSTFKLDEELSARLLCLEKQGLTLLNESFYLSSKLLEFVKRMGQSGGKKDGFGGNTGCFDVQFVIESDMKVQGLRRGTESLMRSLQTISTALNERSDLVTSESQKQSENDDRYGPLNGKNSQDVARVQLKSEILLTSLLRDALYSKNQEVEQLEAELATAARGNDILRCEVQNALDSVSCLTHKVKELELQMIKKDDNVNQLQNDLQEKIKELSIVRGILPKVTEERDVMWEDLKQQTEKNMLLVAEVNTLKKKIEALDEDVLLKEGQITILKDSLNSKSFDLLASPDRTHEFLL